MTCCTTASIHGLRIGISGKQCRNPVTMFYPGVSCFFYLLISSGSMKDLCPPPFRSISSLKSQVIFSSKIGKYLIDLFCLFNGSVVFPKIKHSIGIFCKFWKQCQRSSVSVNRTRGRTSCVNTNSANIFSCILSCIL